MLKFVAAGCLGSFLMFTSLLPASAAPPLRVGNGTAASCTETALASALADAEALGGVTIKFECGGAAVTIDITAFHSVPDGTTIDGENLITLHVTNPNTFSVLGVGVNATVTLQRFAITSPHSSLGIDNAGTLTVSEMSFENDHSVCGSGIHNNGTLTVRNSTFTNGSAFFQGGALCNLGAATVESTVFSGNEGGGGANGGGAVYNAGALTLVKTIFVHNTSFGDPGGAIRNLGSLTVRGSIFYQNNAQRGGAIFIDAGHVTIVKTAIVENTAIGEASPAFPDDARGGGIYNHGGVLTIVHSVIADNTALAGGGGVYTCCGGTTTLTHTVVTDNVPDDVVP